MRIPFTKMHGLGNDFVVIDAVRADFDPEPEMLRWIADRHFGIGCDQILVVAPPSAPDIDFDYRIYNADGSTSGQCGNGARCLARFIEAQGLSDEPVLHVRTRSTSMTLTRLADGQVRVDMGVPRLAPAQIPFLPAAGVDAELPAADYTLALPQHGELRFGVVNVGNPHAVLLVDSVDAAPVHEIGAAMQASAAFPESVNVGFLQVLDEHNARLRVYERGSGETLACGSGACAAAVSGIARGLLRSPVRLALRGGDIKISWAGTMADPASVIEMTGPAETAYTGEFEWPRR